MAHTVIGFFSNSSDAYDAADTLRERGFDIGNVDVSDNNRSDMDEHGREERSGKVGNFFRSLFSDNDDDADRYSNAAHENSLVTVHASDRDEAERAAEILDSCGAIDVDEGYGSRGGAYSGTGSGAFSETGSGAYAESEHDVRDFDSGLGESDLDTERTASFARDKDFDRTDEASIPVVEEEVNIGKREVRRGGVRLRSRIIEKPVEETLRLREERVNVERVPVDRDVTDDDLENFREETVEVHEYGEEPIVSKRSRVVEEVRVGKEVHERQETVREKARKKEVDVENIEDEEKLRSSRKR
ncbi:MAG TPA: YsnF/AvaK domain-containing protein [Bacteroidales bacterium]|jgi:stress response protein YsnF|nr:YsnF/AvaK domain-containing protein [Bacteroidales bacterium]